MPKPGQASAVWGPPLWGFLEALPFLINEKKEDIQAVVTFLEVLQEVLTCRVCRTHLGKFLESYANKMPTTRKELSMMINDAHNNVNNIHNTKCNTQFGNLKHIWTLEEHLQAAKKSAEVWKNNLFDYLWFPLAHFPDEDGNILGPTWRWLLSLQLVLKIFDHRAARSLHLFLFTKQTWSTELLLNWLDTEFRVALAVDRFEREVYEARIADAIKLGRLLHEKNSQVVKKENVIASSAMDSKYLVPQDFKQDSYAPGVPFSGLGVPSAAVVINKGGRKIKDQSRVQCACFTAKGVQCLNYAMKGKTKCKIHKNKKVCKGQNRAIADAKRALPQPGDMEAKNELRTWESLPEGVRKSIQERREQGVCQCYNMDGTPCKNRAMPGSLNCMVHKHCIRGYSYHSSFGKVYNKT